MEYVNETLYRPLNSKQMKNIYLATLCGCFNAIYSVTPGPVHLKTKRCLSDLHGSVVKGLIPFMAPVHASNHDAFQNHVKACNIVLSQIKGNGATMHHVLLNLAGYCLEKLPAKENHLVKFRELFNLWHGVWDTKDYTELGDVIFARIDKELKAIVLQNGIL